jgi:hypothetical protein
MIAGLPHETPESWAESEQWLRDNWSDGNWDWWPLEISLDTTTETTSVFSKEWKQHGYRKITDQTRIDEINVHYSRDTGGTQHKFDHNSLYWEADWADIGQASEFVRDWKNDEWRNKNLKVASFHMLNYLPFYPNKEELLNLKEFEVAEALGTDEQWSKIVGPYVKSKLEGVKRLKDLVNSGAGPMLISPVRDQYFERCTHNRRLSELWASIN